MSEFVAKIGASQSIIRGERLLKDVMVFYKGGEEGYRFGTLPDPYNPAHYFSSSEATDLCNHLVAVGQVESLSDLRIGRVNTVQLNGGLDAT